MIGVGNAFRSDDAVGLAVARKLAGTVPPGVEVLEREGEPTALIGAWEGDDCVWLVDAASSVGEPGTIHRLDATEHELPVDVFRTTTHHVGLAEAVEIARAVGKLPARLVVYGIEGARFDTGEELTPEVEAAAERAAAAVRDEVVAEVVTRSSG